MTKTVWITRTQPSAQASAGVWQAAGFKAVVAPLLHVVNAPKTPAKPAPDDVLIFTSKNGVFAYQGYGFAPQNKVITVGDATAAAARAAGFTDVTSAQGTSADVTALIVNTVAKNSSVIHCAGRHVRGSIVEDLNAAGYLARRDLYYQSEAVTAWPAIDYAALTHIAFYSPFAAETFRDLIIQKTSRQVSLDIHKSAFISISNATNMALGDFALGRRWIADLPNEMAMLKAIKGAKVKDV